MKILVVGGGGREHAIITSIAKSSKVTKSIVHREMQVLQNWQNVWISVLWNLINWLISQRRKQLILQL